MQVNPTTIETANRAMGSLEPIRLRGMVADDALSGSDQLQNGSCPDCRPSARRRPDHKMAARFSGLTRHAVTAKHFQPVLYQALPKSGRAGQPPDLRSLARFSAVIIRWIRRMRKFS